MLLTIISKTRDAYIKVNTDFQSYNFFCTGTRILCDVISHGKCLEYEVAGYRSQKEAHESFQKLISFLDSGHDGTVDLSKIL